MKKATKNTRSVEKLVLWETIKGMIMAVIIIAMFFAFMHAETATYMGIDARRDENANALKWKTTDMHTIERNSDQCDQEFEVLSERSPLGEFLVKNDQTFWGRVLNFIIVRGSRTVVVICVICFLYDCCKTVEFFYIYRRKRNAQNYNNQPPTFDTGNCATYR